MKLRKLSRRRFILAAILGAAGVSLAGAVAEARWFEPRWVKVHRIRLGDRKPTRRVVHITDIHHKGDRALLEGVVKKINALSPDLVCFTGDLIEEGNYLAEALAILAGIKSPLYGVPGNHDYWSKTPFSEMVKCFAATGGGWLTGGQAVSRDGQFTLFGAVSHTFKEPPLRPNPATRNILLMHFPAWVKQLGPAKFDLVLAGHSHGGQVRFPFFGPIMVPYGVDEYDLGLFRTAAGPLYVNPGIGWFPWPIRFNCRPEITVFDM